MDGIVTNRLTLPNSTNSDITVMALIIFASIHDSDNSISLSRTTTCLHAKLEQQHNCIHGGHFSPHSLLCTIVLLSSLSSSSSIPSCSLILFPPPSFVLSFLLFGRSVGRSNARNFQLCTETRKISRGLVLYQQQQQQQDWLKQEYGKYANDNYKLHPWRPLFHHTDYFVQSYYYYRRLRLLHLSRLVRY